MLRKTITLLALGLLLAPIAHAQSVDDILAKHYEACGGLAKMKAVTSTRYTGTMTMGPGMEAPLTIDLNGCADAVASVLVGLPWAR